MPTAAASAPTGAARAGISSPAPVANAAAAAACPDGNEVVTGVRPGRRVPRHLAGRAWPAHQALGEDVAGRARDRHAGQASQGRPAASLVLAGGQCRGDADPQHEEIG
jgi:hypothetical protein